MRRAELRSPRQFGGEVPTRCHIHPSMPCESATCDGCHFASSGTSTWHGGQGPLPDLGDNFEPIGLPSVERLLVIRDAVHPLRAEHPFQRSRELRRQRLEALEVKSLVVTVVGAPVHPFDVVDQCYPTGPWPHCDACRLPCKLAAQYRGHS